MAKLWILQSDHVKKTLGANNWIEAITEDFGKIARMVRRLEPEWPTRTTIYDVEVDLPAFVVLESVDHPEALMRQFPKAHAWSWKFSFFDRQGLVKHLAETPRVLLPGEDGPEGKDQHYMIQPIGREFASPCPGWDMMGLMDHEHVDNNFLEYGLTRTVGTVGSVLPQGRLLNFLNSKPRAYFNRSLKQDWYKKRVAEYKKFIS